MIIKVLGPLDTGTEPLSPRERTMLSALVVRLGTGVAPAELAEAWWGESPPRTWEQQVRNAVAAIRARLGKDAVDRAGGEYRLGLDPDAVDSVRFERLVSSARGHSLRAEHDRAADAYGRALGLWRGAPLQDVANWEPGAVEAMRLGEIRASTEEELLTARLAAGEHRTIIADAERLLREEPLREDRWSILALANYRADRQAEALAVLRSARERLADELGIEPGPRLAGLELAMLRRDPALEAPNPAPTADAPCPYPGLRAFGPDDADIFFGRDADTEAVLERIARGAVVTIVGASGTGKSSLALAGVLPRLRARGRSAEVVRPGAGVRAMRRAMERGDILAIDQAEELLNASPGEIEEFAGIARSFLDGGGAILLTLRSDALDRVRAIPRFGDDIGRGVYVLGPLSDTAYRSAIEEPAHAAGLRVEPGLVELAVRDAGDRAATLPHLSHAMQETWNRREGTALTVDGYRLSGGIPGAIAQSAEDAFRALAPDDQAVCRSLMMRLLDRTVDGTSTRRRVPAEPLLADAARRRVLERLTRARLVTVDGDAATVAHEAVATAWPRLDAWLEEDAEGARTMRAVESASEAWDAGGRHDDDLLRGARLHSALDWRDSADPDLTAVEAELLTASEDHEQRELNELSERAGRDRRRNRVLGAALMGSAVLLVAALVAGGIAGIRGQEAAASGENARIEALVATSLAQRSSDTVAAALLAAEAYRRWPGDTRVRSALLGLISTAGGHLDTHRVAGAARSTMSMIPGTATALQTRDGEGGSAVEIVDVATGRVAMTLAVDLPEVLPRYYRSIDVSGDGRVAVIQTPRLVDPDDSASCCWNHVTFVDVDAGEPLEGTQLLRMRTSMHFELGQDGSVAFFSHPITGDLVAIDPHTGDVRASSPDAFGDYTGIDSRYGAIAIVDADTVATAVDDRIDLFDRRTLELERSLPLEFGHGGDAIVADGSGGLVSGGDLGMVRIDVSGDVRWTRALARGDICYQMLLTPRGTIVCAELGDVTEWDLETGAATGQRIVPHLDAVADIDIIDETTILVPVPTNALWMRWRTDGSGAAKTAIAEGHVISGEPDIDGDLIPTYTRVGDRVTARAWSLSDRAPTGIETDGLSLLGGGYAEYWNEGEGFGLVDVRTGERHPYRIPGLPDEFWLHTGGWGAHAFVAFDDQIVAFDPATGEAFGSPMEVVDSQLGALLTASEEPDGSRAAVTWFDPAASRTETAVFDMATGEILARGLYDVDSSIIVSPDSLVAVADESVQRYSLETLEAESTLPLAASGSTQLALSADGRTLLNVGARNRLNLYDLTDDIMLADPIDADTVYNVRGGQLSADGMTLFTNSEDAIIMWNLDPAAQAAAACDLAGREFSAQEWATYFPGEAQVPTCAELGG